MKKRNVPFGTKYMKDRAPWAHSDDPIVKCQFTGRFIARVPSKMKKDRAMSSRAVFDTKEEAEAFLEKYHTENPITNG